MYYRDETFALYDALFTEARRDLIKEGVLARLGRGVKAMGQAWKSTSSAARHAAEVAAREAKMVEMAQALSKETAARQALETAHGTATKELQQFGATPGALTSAQKWRNIGLAGTGLGAVGVPMAYGRGQHGAEQKARTTRNLAFGAGTAAGLAAPQLVTGLGAIANAAGQTGLFPEFQGAGFDPNAPQGNY